MNVVIPINFTFTTGTTLDLTHDNAMLVFQHIWNLSNVSNGCYGVDIAFVVVNASFYQATFTSNCSLQHCALGFSRFIFDKTAIESLGSQYFSYG
jgi:hypothetical protein